MVLEIGLLTELFPLGRQPLWSELRNAIRGNSSEQITRLLDRAGDINEVHGTYGTALAEAALRGYMDIVSLLLDRGADINMVGGEYGTPLAAAAFKGNMDMVLMLLNRGADINLVGGKYGSALAVAVFGGHTGIVSLLLERGADITHVGGSYLTTSGVYPSALDVAHTLGSKANRTLIALLKSEIRKQIKQQSDPNLDSVGIIGSRPPFPMTSMPSTSLQHPPPISSIPSNLSTADGNITSALADVPCRNISEEVLANSLATLVGLNKDTIQAQHHLIRDDIGFFNSWNYDFGLAYASVRVAWKGFNDKHSIDCNAISIPRDQWHKHVQMLDRARSEAIELGNSSSGQAHLELIISPYSIMPRRLWDLKSNRVIDFRMLHAAQVTIETTPTFWAVSHSWTNDMPSVWTAINQNQWPIPLPKGISLDHLRSELLTLGAEYIWLDVVCLRQEGEVDSFEQLRREEWKLDVPTIGNVYRAATKIVRYFNGLGVSFSTNGWDDERHWLQRAWTLQEIAKEHTTINGGVSRDRGQVLLNSEGKVSGKVIKFRYAIQPVIKLAGQVDSRNGCGVYELAREMSRRHASKPVDKISGLFYLLRTTKLPCYNEQMTSEDFWGQCFHLLPAERKAEILFNFPYRASDKQWFPTWEQLLNWPERNLDYEHVRSQSPVGLTGGGDPGGKSFFVNTWTIPHATLNDTATPGEYEVEIHNRLFGFYLPYLSQKFIDVKGQSFTLAIADLGHAAHAQNWVVCEAIGKKIGTDVGLDGAAEVYVLKKVGVIRTDSSAEIDALSLLQKMHCLFV